MSLPAVASISPINLEFTSGSVHVATVDQDRFAVAAQHAVSVSEVRELDGDSTRLFAANFLAPVRRWCESQSDRVHQCYISTTSGRTVKVYVVRRAVKFDFALSDAIAHLEATLISDGWSCDILQVGPAPHEGLRQFFDPGNSLQVY